jgi:hypothetical protein
MATGTQSEISKAFCSVVGMTAKDFDRLNGLPIGFTTKALFRGHNTLIEKSYGLANHPLWSTWMNMKRRCEDSNSPYYHLYGAKGIRVCQRWALSFQNFLDDMGEKPDGCTLDRIDPNKWYTKENCRWATGDIQAANRVTKVGKAGYRGVTVMPNGYLSIMRVKGKDFRFGTYVCPVIAHEVYRKEFIKQYGFEPKSFR